MAFDFHTAMNGLLGSAASGVPARQELRIVTVRADKFSDIRNLAGWLRINAQIVSQDPLTCTLRYDPTEIADEDVAQAITDFGLRLTSSE